MFSFEFIRLLNQFQQLPESKLKTIETMDNTKYKKFLIEKGLIK